MPSLPRPMNEEEANRAGGALLGLATGDALGTTLEFTAPAVPPFPARLTGPHRTITGGGPFRLAPGEVTDDTQMACCLAASLRERSAFEAGDVVQRYIAWREAAFDVGVQTSAALEHARKDPLRGGRIVWERRSGVKPAGNGSLMRAAPIGVCFMDTDEGIARARIAASWLDSSLTHFDPRCLLACVAFNAAVAAGIRGETRPQMRDAAESDLIAAARSQPEDDPGVREAIRGGTTDVLQDLRLAQGDDPMLERITEDGGLDILGQAGFVRVAFRLAFWELLHAPSFEEALIDVVNRGGDADTNGAVAGALLGAHFGKHAIPSDWQAVVLGARGLRPAYHPRVLLDLVTALTD